MNALQYEKFIRYSQSNLMDIFDAGKSDDVKSLINEKRCFIV